VFPSILIKFLHPSEDYPVKIEPDRALKVEARIFKDGQLELINARLKYRAQDSLDWKYADMHKTQHWEDIWQGELVLTDLGQYFYTIEAWIDSYNSWLEGLKKKVEGGTCREGDILQGKALVERAYHNAQGHLRLKYFYDILQHCDNPLEIFLNPELNALMCEHQEKTLLTESKQVFEIWVEPVQARFAAWYEMFPRSAANNEHKHGTFKDCHQWLDYIKDLGFDTIYFPPIHPIGKINRKGKNNALLANESDIGSPWAIQDHLAVHPELGTLDDFRELVQAASAKGLSIALDFAIQFSPDHAYLEKHRNWFFIRPDGTIQYAENPPKEYQDIYPINFWCEEREHLWKELKAILEFWIEQGVKVFRVDNPHTKPFVFWEWVIRELKQHNPELIFLAEAFTLPHKMYELARLGYTQSYTYFTWRNSKPELEQYISEITSKELQPYFRGNLFANTPDILNDYLQKGGYEAFCIRAILAATLSPVYGIYSGFELCENTPEHEGSEEYLDSEKYQLKARNFEAEPNIKHLLKQPNLRRVLDE
jgi:starch synthase (maltosyl-transferring)